MRAVLDANVLISAFVYPRGGVVPVWRAALAQRYILVTSPEIVTEFAEVLRRTFGWDGPRINRQLKRITRRAEIISPRQTLHVIPEDPDDDRILECAVAYGGLIAERACGSF